jgi:hypothetical protein
MLTVLNEDERRTEVRTQQYELGLYIAVKEEGIQIPLQASSKLKEVAYHRKIRKKLSWVEGESSPIPKKPKLIKEIWDNGGKTTDRFTVILNSSECLALSEHPEHPQGFSQTGIAVSGEHLGKRINFYDLPYNIILHICKRLEET